MLNIIRFIFKLFIIHIIVTEELDSTETSKSPDPSETSNLLENSSQYIKCGESNKLLGEEDEKAMSSPVALRGDTQGYETPIKTIRKEVTTPTNECPQYYTNMCATRPTSLTENDS